MMVIEITIGFLLFCVGFLLGRVNLLQKTMQQRDYRVIQTTEPKNLTKHNKTIDSEADTPMVNLPKISIDESKFVTEVKTDSFQKDFKDLGEKTVSEDNISSSVTKLSQLKRNKE